MNLHLPTDPRKRMLVIFGAAGAGLGAVVLVRRHVSGSSTPGTTLVSGDTDASTDDGADGTVATGDLSTGAAATDSSGDLSTLTDMFAQLLSTMQTTQGGVSTVSAGADDTGGVVTSVGTQVADAPPPAVLVAPAAPPTVSGPGSSPINAAAIPKWAAVQPPTAPQSGIGPSQSSYLSPAVEATASKQSAAPKVGTKANSGVHAN